MGEPAKRPMTCSDMTDQEQADAPWEKSVVVLGPTFGTVEKDGTGCGMGMAVHVWCVCAYVYINP